MHRLLEQQLKDAFGRTEGFSPELERFIALVDATYRQGDEGRSVDRYTAAHHSQVILDGDLQLSESEERSRGVFENVARGVFQTAPDGQIISADRTMARILGYHTLAELQAAKADLPSLIGFAPEKWDEITQQLKQKGSISQVIFATLGTDDNARWLSFDAAVVNDISGNVLCYEGTLRDVTLQRLAQKELRERTQELANSLSLLNATLESTADGILAVQFSGKVICFNQKYADMWGIPVERLKDGNDKDLLTFVTSKVKDPEKFLARIEELKMQGASESFDLIELRDGRTFERYVKPQRVEGRPVGMVINFRDITERKEAEEALRRSREELRSIIDTIPHIIWSALPTGEIDYCSQRSVEYFGRSIGELIGNSWADIVHPDDLNGTIENWSHSLATGKLYENEFRLLRADGVYRWHLALAMPLRDADGTTIKWYGTNTNIDDQKRAEKALRESDEKFRQIAENISDVFWITSLDHQTLYYASPAYETVWGKSLESLYANPTEWVAAILTEEHERVFAEFAKLATDDHVCVEYRIRRADGEIRWIRDRCFRVLNANGDVIRIAGMAGDITERKHAEVELDIIHKQLLETSRQAGMAEVATSVLHNIGNVLNSVNVACSVITEKVRKSRITSVAKTAELLREQSGNLAAFLTEDPTGQKLPFFLTRLAERLRDEQASILNELDSLHQNIEHIKEIVVVQQSYAKIGGIRETVSIAALVDDALHMSAAAFSQRGVKVIREFENVPLICSEKHKILQILINLLRNANDALTPGIAGEKRVIVRIAREWRCILVSISDNGVGIAPENLTRIFAHGFTTKKNGHGFGLHSSSLAAQEMGGTLTVQSDGPGTGATFTLELPLEEEG